MFIVRNVVCRVLSVGRPWGWGAQHQSSCLRCQATAVSTRNMEKVLADLADDIEEAPPAVMIGLHTAMDGGEMSMASPRREFPSKAAGAAAMAAVSVADFLWRRRALRAA